MMTTIESILAPFSGAGAIVQIRSENGNTQTFACGALKAHKAIETARFPIYSLAKSILSLIVLSMRDAGLIDLDEPIKKYLRRDLPDWLNRVTLRTLLSHRSGLYDYGALSGYHEEVRQSPHRARKAEDFIQEILEKGPQFEVGQGFFYSNVGYVFVREILENKGRAPLSALFDKYIRSKVDLTFEFIEGPSSKIIPGFSPYLKQDAPDIRGLYDFSWVFHGAFVGSISDVTKLFAKMNQFVSAESFQEMIQLHPVDFPHPHIRPSYGLGLMGDLQSSFGPVLGHTGEGPGFSVAAYWVPDKKLSIAVVINRDSIVSAEKLVFETLKQL